MSDRAGPAPTMGMVCMEFLAPSFGLVQAQLLWAQGVAQQKGVICPSKFQMNYINYLFKNFKKVRENGNGYKSMRAFLSISFYT